MARLLVLEPESGIREQLLLTEKSFSGIGGVDSIASGGRGRGTMPEGHDILQEF